MDFNKNFYKVKIFSEIDLHFAKFMMDFSLNKDPLVGFSAALVSSKTHKGDVCIDLNTLADSSMTTEKGSVDELAYPELSIWADSLQKSDVVGRPGEHYPLILDKKNRLYLFRYWEYEQKLSDLIKVRTEAGKEDIDTQLFKKNLEKLFPMSGKGNAIDWQMVAAIVAVLKRFCVISGGPGTGKTYTVARILALLLSQNIEDLRIFLCAPTGKAAARLGESIASAKADLTCGESIKRRIPEEGQTIHRMLRPIKGSPYFRYNEDNPLSADVVIVDEASMVDLPLMSKLIQALDHQTKLILIGDRNQLASVEAGSVLGDICGHKYQNGFSESFSTCLQELTGDQIGPFDNIRRENTALSDCIVFFEKPYRFEKESRVHALSQAVNENNAESAIDILAEKGNQEIRWVSGTAGINHQSFLVGEIIDHYRGLFETSNVAAALACLDNFRVLCAVNHGRFGVKTINALTEREFIKKGLINPGFSANVEWYHGKPILVTANNYNLGIYNGDVGVTILESESKQKKYTVHFQQEPGKTKGLASFRIPRHEPVYAMTIHKSQGSEFDEVMLVLPDVDNPILTKELLYTGITRTRRKLSILASESVIRIAVSRTIQRTSGLRDALWQ